MTYHCNESTYYHEYIIFLRWSGLLTIIVGILFIGMSILIDLTLYGSLNSWPPVFLLGVTPGMLLSLISIYLSQLEEMGAFGFISFLIAFVGSALTGSVMFYSFIHFFSFQPWPWKIVNLTNILALVFN